MGRKSEGTAPAGFFKKMFGRNRPITGRTTPNAVSKERESVENQGRTMGNQRIKFDLFIHDLKVPLAVIEAGVLSLLDREEKYGSLSEKQKKVLHRVLRNTKVTKSLVNDAMEIGRANMGIIVEDSFRISEFIEQSLEEIFDLTDLKTAECIRECSGLESLKSLLAERGIGLHVDEGLWNEEIQLDETKMKQILRNLLNNALKYRQERVDVKVEKGEESLALTVSDDGQGIPQTYHKHIFECYFQMDMKEQHCVRGHGLGLAGVSVLVEDMKGRLSLVSDAGKGATFIVEVPL
jgi:two-component system, OmpR family, sensor kinase